MIPHSSGIPKWIVCPVPHPSAELSARHLLQTYDATSDKRNFSNVVVNVMDSPLLRQQLGEFIDGFKKVNMNEITGRPYHLRKYKELYTAIVVATAADSETTGNNAMGVHVLTSSLQLRMRVVSAPQLNARSDDAATYHLYALHQQSWTCMQGNG